LGVCPAIGGAAPSLIGALPNHWGSAKSLGGCPVIGGVPCHCGHAQSLGICLGAVGGWRGFLRATPERRAVALRRMRSRRGLRLKARLHKECGHRRKTIPSRQVTEIISQVEFRTTRGTERREQLLCAGLRLDPPGPSSSRTPAPRPPSPMLSPEEASPLAYW